MFSASNRNKTSCHLFMTEQLSRWQVYAINGKTDEHRNLRDCLVLIIGLLSRAWAAHII